VSVVCCLYVVVCGYVIYKNKGLWQIRKILIILTMSNLLYLVTVSIMYADTINNCKVFPLKPGGELSNWTLAVYVLSRVSMFGLFLAGYWLMFYKYWEFALFFNKERPTERETQMLICGKKAGLVVVAISSIITAIMCYTEWVIKPIDNK